MTDEKGRLPVLVPGQPYLDFQQIKKRLHLSEVQVESSRTYPPFFKKGEPRRGESRGPELKKYTVNKHT